MSWTPFSLVLRIGGGLSDFPLGPTFRGGMHWTHEFLNKGQFWGRRSYGPSMMRDIKTDFLPEGINTEHSHGVKAKAEEKES
jgi:hypothetical protein